MIQLQRRIILPLGLIGVLLWQGYASGQQVDWQDEVKSLQARIRQLERERFAPRQMSDPFLRKRSSHQKKDPFSKLEIMEERMDELFGDAVTEWQGRNEADDRLPLGIQQQIRLLSGKEEYLVLIRIQGVPDDQTEVKVEGGTVTVKVREKKLHGPPEHEKGADLYSTILNVILLPADVDSALARIAKEQGLWTVRIPVK